MITAQGKNVAMGERKRFWTNIYLDTGEGNTVIIEYGIGPRQDQITWYDTPPPGFPQSILDDIPPRDELLTMLKERQEIDRHWLLAHRGIPGFDPQV